MSAAGEKFSRILECFTRNTSGFAVNHNGFLTLFMLNLLRKMTKFLISLKNFACGAYFANEIPYFANFGQTPPPPTPRGGGGYHSLPKSQLAYITTESSEISPMGQRKT